MFFISYWCKLCLFNIKEVHIFRIDVSTAFLQTIPAARYLYGISPSESRQRDVVWFLLDPLYGLLNSNEKWQVKSDGAITSLYFIESPAVPQLFFHFNAKCHVYIVPFKIVDYVLAADTVIHGRNI